MLYSGIVNKLDFLDIVSLVVLKLMLFFNGGKDKLFLLDVV